MKKILTLLIVNIFLVGLSAQLIKNDFMDNIAIGDNIEIGDYFADGGFMPNQWNLSSANNVQGGASPVAVAPLTYEGYAESGVSNAFLLKKLGTGNRVSSYTIANAEDALANYASGSFYLAFMMKVDKSTIAGAGVGVLNLDGSHVGNFRRTALFVKKLDDDTFTFGLYYSESVGNSNTLATYIDDSYDFGTTHLVVLKHDMGETPNNEEIALFVNPDLETLDEPTPLIVEIPSVQPLLKDKGIRAISVRQRTNYQAAIGGLRFARSWTTALGIDPASGINNTSSSSIISKEYYTLTGTKIDIPLKRSIYIEKAVYDNGKIQWTKKILGDY